MKDSLIYKLPSTIPLSLSILFFSMNFSLSPKIYILSIIPLPLLLIKEKKTLSILSILLFFLSLLIVIFTIPPNSFFNFSLIILFLLLIVLTLISINYFFPLSFSFILLFISIYLLEINRGFNIFTFILGFTTILFSLLINSIKDKDLNLWENRFIIRKGYKKGIIIVFILIISVSPLFVLIPRVGNINIPNSIFTITPKNRVGEEKIEKITKNEENESIPIFKRISIGKIVRKIIFFVLNYIYVVSLFGFLLLLTLMMILLYKSIKGMAGRKRALKIVLTSFFSSLGLFILLYLSYIPFTKLIKFISKIKEGEKIGTTGFTINFSRYMNRFKPLKGFEIKSISIDIFVVIAVVIFSLLTSTMIILLILHLSKETFGKRALKRELILDEFRVEPKEENELSFSGSPREKIIKLYRLLLKKLKIILGKKIYETPFEYKERIEIEKPIISKEMDIITKNFVISRYSNYNISDKIWEKTKKAFIKLKEKIFKEVINGR